MSILVENISKNFGTFKALDHINLEIQRGDIVALIGASGSGKSTLLRIIAGLEKPDQGQIWLHEKNTNFLSIQEREIGYVFQNYALFKHLTVYENIAFSLDIRNKNPLIRDQRVRELLEVIELEKLGDWFPNKLSGGQRQRVALARAMANKPKILLLDEPFGALDRVIRKELRIWLRNLHSKNDVTTVFVTHDHIEARRVADEIVVLKSGRVKDIQGVFERFKKKKLR